MQSLAQLLRSGQAAGLAALRVALPAPGLPPDPQVHLQCGCAISMLDPELWMEVRNS